LEEKEAKAAAAKSEKKEEPNPATTPSNTKTNIKKTPASSGVVTRSRASTASPTPNSSQEIDEPESMESRLEVPETPAVSNVVAAPPIEPQPEYDMSKIVPAPVVVLPPVYLDTDDESENDGNTTDADDAAEPAGEAQEESKEDPDYEASEPPSDDDSSEVSDDADDDNEEVTDEAPATTATKKRLVVNRVADVLDEEQPNCSLHAATAKVNFIARTFGLSDFEELLDKKKFKRLGFEGFPTVFAEAIIKFSIAKGNKKWFRDLLTTTLNSKDDSEGFAGQQLFDLVVIAFRHTGCEELVTDVIKHLIKVK